VSEREPEDRVRRPNGVMPDAVRSSDHAAHDPLVVVAGTDPAASAAERAAAERQVADCEACALLASDLRSIASGLASLPRTVAAPAGRDFRITSERARQLRSGSRLRRWLRPFGAGGFQGIRPLAATFTSLGVAGLLFAVLLPGIGSVGIGSNSQALTSGSGAGGAEVAPKDASGSPATAFFPSSSVPGAEGSSGSGDYATRSSSAPQPAVSTDNAARTGAAVQGPSPLVVLSLVLLVIGVVLFGLRLAAHRIR
jgi:hypothetical protein